MNNYHTHTYRCNHAYGDVCDYAQVAITSNNQYLGISDHTPLPDNRWLSIRMAIDEIDEYEESIQTARKKYPKLTILKGLECDWCSEYANFYKEELLQKRKYDYLIGSVHFHKYQNEWYYAFNPITTPHLLAYSNSTIEAIQSKLFNFIAHPDLFRNGYPDWNENTKACCTDIIQAAAENNIPLELNGSGFSKELVIDNGKKRLPYPCIKFWEIAAEHNISVVCNSDAHTPTHLNKNIEKCQAFAKKLGLKILTTPQELKMHNQTNEK